MVPTDLSKEALEEAVIEECSELVAALAKVLRKKRGESPTPDTCEQIEANVLEEIADVQITLDTLIRKCGCSDSLRVIRAYKIQRWCDRLNTAHTSNDNLRRD